MKINKEGYKIIGITGVVCVLLWWLMYYLLSQHSVSGLLWFGTLLIVLFWFFIVAFFREPRRVKIHDPELVFAPCDGRVVVTEVVHEHEYLDREMLQISIFMSITNVHMNWVPVGGTVEYFKYHPGRFLVAWHPKSSTENERTTTVVRTTSGKEVLFRQVAGLIARRIVSYMKVGAPARFAGRSVKAAVIIRSPAHPVRQMNKKPGRTHVAARCVNQSFLAKRMPIVRAAVSV